MTQRTDDYSELSRAEEAIAYAREHMEMYAGFVAEFADIDSDVAALYEQSILRERGRETYFLERIPALLAELNRS